jgi:hypothetical protein
MKVLIEKFIISISATGDGMNDDEVSRICDLTTDLDIDFEAIIRQKLEEVMGDDASRMIINIES